MTSQGDSQSKRLSDTDIRQPKMAAVINNISCMFYERTS